MIINNESDGISLSLEEEQDDNDFIEQQMLSERMRQQKICFSCPVCGSEMCEKSRLLLHVYTCEGARSVNVCSMGCSVMFYKRNYGNKKEVSSSIEIIKTKEKSK